MALSINNTRVLLFLWWNPHSFPWIFFSCCVRSLSWTHPFEGFHQLFCSLDSGVEFCTSIVLLNNLVGLIRFLFLWLAFLQICQLFLYQNYVVLVPAIHLFHWSFCCYDLLPLNQALLSVFHQVVWVPVLHWISIFNSAQFPTRD